MKRINIIFCLFISFLIAGCQNSETSTIKNLEQNNIPDYKPESEDVIGMYGEIENIKRFKEFLNNVEQGNNDSIRVVIYTVEGDPMLQELEYDGEVIKSITDTRRDKFGEGSIFSTTCTSIEVVKTTEMTEYILKGCENGLDNTILVTGKQ